MSEDFSKVSYGIDEVEGDVTLMAKQNDKAVYLKSKALAGDKGYIDIEPILYQGHFLSFGSKNYTLKLQSIKNNMRLEFNVLGVKLVKLEDDRYAHRVYSNENKRCKNLREFKRFSICDPGVVQLGSHHKAIECIVKDISYGGFGLTVNGKSNIPVNELLHLSFSHRHGIYITAVQANALVVRTNYLDEREETFIGLKLLTNNTAVQKVVSEIQRDELYKLAKPGSRR